MSRNNIPPQVRDFVKYLRSEGLYKLYDINKGSLLYHSQDKANLPFDFIQDLFKKHCPNQDWCDWQSYITASIDKIIGFYFKPNAPRLLDVGLGANRLNTYQEYKPETNNSDCPLFIQMLERMFPDDNERHTLTQWIAHMIQFPQERPTWAVLLTSDEGTGKGVLFNKIISPLVKNQTTQCSKYQQFLGDHSTALADTLFVMLDDTKSHNDSVITELKSKISEPTILLNRKFEQPYTQNVYSRVLLASNERRPIKLGKNDTRRWFAPAYIVHPVSRAETQAFFDKVLDWLALDCTAVDKIYNYLNNYTLEGFNSGLVQATETLEMMVEVSESTREGEVRDWCNQHKVFKLEDLTTHFNEFPDLAKSYALNFALVKKIDLDGNGRNRWWIPKNWKVKDAKDWFNSNNKPTPILF